MRLQGAQASGARGPVVVWLSGAFGYAGELLYFEDIFTGLLSNFPSAVVPVAVDFPADRYPHLPLVPLMKYIRLGMVRRRVGSVEYPSVRRIPTPGSLVRLARLRPDVLLLTEFSLVSLAGFLTAKVTRTRTVVLVESDPTYRGAPANRAFQRVKSLVARSADAVLVSNAIGARYLTDLGVSPTKLKVGPYLTSAPGGESVTPAAARRGPVRLLFLNSVTKRKGVDHLLRALALTDPALRGSWVLDVFGSGDHEPEVRALAEELGLAANVEFHGRVAYRSAAQCYRDCDVVVAPTLADYRSLSGFEAVNAARPLLISRYDGASEELSRLAPAVTVIDPLDEVAFAAALEPFLSRLDFLAHQQRAALNVPKEFLMSTAVKNVVDVVDLALRRAKPD